MLCKNLASLVCIAMFLTAVFVQDSLPQTGFTYSEGQSNKKLGELQALDGDIEQQQTNLQNILRRYSVIEKGYKEIVEKYNRAKSDYEAASQAMHVMTNERFQQLQNIFKDAQRQLQEAESQLKYLQADKERFLMELRRLQQLRAHKKIELLKSQADAYDAKMDEWIWAVGEGESLLSEDKTPKQAAELAVQYAIRDATERGGKALIQSVSSVEMFKLVKDDISVYIRVQVVEQDRTGDYGKAKRIISGDLIKYVAKVRLKLRSASDYNPYTERLKSLTAKSATDDERGLGVKGLGVKSALDSCTIKCYEL